MLFMCGTYFALRSGLEHRALRFSPSQMVKELSWNIQKTFPKIIKAALKGGKAKEHHENTDNPSRCFLHLYKLYLSKCPVDRPANAFYLQPLKNPTHDCWFSAVPIGHVTLASTVARMCKSAGITGYKTNHSLRATAATRLYQAGIDEQLIMEKTGHRSWRVLGVTNTLMLSSKKTFLIFSLSPRNRHFTSRTPKL